MSCIKISIIIPTFNRLDNALEQIRFLLREKTTLKNKHQFILSDNASDMRISEVLKNVSDSSEFQYRRNERNIGLVGNLIAALQCSEGDYTWFVSDDDELSVGILKQIEDQLIANQPDILFINHFATRTTTGEVVLESALPTGWQDNRSGTMLDIYEHSGTTLMFITACVYKTSLLKEALQTDKDEHTRLTLPLYWSLFCGQDNNVSYINKICINNVWGETSWKANIKVVFGILVPRELQKCLHMRYQLHKTLPIYVKMKVKELSNKLLLQFKR